MIRDCWNSIGVNGDSSCPELPGHAHCRNCPTYGAAAVELLADLSSTEGLTERTEYFAQPRQSAERESQSAVVFRVGAEWLGISTGVVLQVTRPARIHSLPNRRSRIVLGVVNVGGELLACASLAGVLGIDDAAADAAAPAMNRVLIVRHDTIRAACPVDEIHGIVRFHPGGLQAAPATLTRASASFTESLLPWQGTFVGMVDTRRLFQTFQRSFA
jgi:chemotaxis-related protein WspD